MDNPVKLYLAGGMRGYPDLNHPEFFAKAKLLTDAGYDVCNPAEHDELFQRANHRHPTIREALEYDLLWLCQEADGVALLSGWEQSFGARAEVAVAQAIGIPHNFVIHWLQKAKAAAVPPEPGEQATCRHGEEQ